MTVASKASRPQPTIGVLALLECHRPSGFLESLLRVEELLSGDCLLLLSDHATPVGGTTSQTRFVPDTWSTVAALASMTDGATVGTMVSPLLLYDTQRLADQILTAWELSGGRLLVGLGTGWSQADFDAYGVAMSTPSERLARFRDQLSDLMSVVSEGVGGGDEIDFMVGTFGTTMIERCRDLVGHFGGMGPPSQWRDRAEACASRGIVPQRWTLALGHPSEMQEEAFSDALGVANVVLMSDVADTDRWDDLSRALRELQDRWLGV